MNRSDPHQARARELCATAGIDPDSRVGEGRGMPAWCTFRDAARAEHNKREADKAAAEIAANTIAPQGDAYKDASLKVFGDHDQGTIDQMRNCMSLGNVVAGVICADGHLGYAQPVGGVIAYENQISISGVGFDIGCGNMAVRLDTPFEEISGIVPTIARDISKAISFGVGRTNEERVEHPLFDDGEAWVESDMDGIHLSLLSGLGKLPSRRPLPLHQVVRRRGLSPSSSATSPAGAWSAPPTRNSSQRSI